MQMALPPFGAEPFIIHTFPFLWAGVRRSLICFYYPDAGFNFTPSTNRYMISRPWPVLLLAIIPFLNACNDEKEDETAAVDKSGSVETAVSVEHADSTHDVLLTRHKVWVNYKEYATVEHRDTVPALGMLSTEGENSQGETQKLNVKKDYQIFITVK
jgi:hypothetical protein